MLEAEQLDAVSVCTPPKFHKDAVIAALEAGLHVLCEKPLAMSAAEAREMVDASARTGKLLVTAFCHWFHEPVIRAREIIRSGKIGKVTMFRSRFGGILDFAQVWFSNPEISGGGTLPDTSIHSFDLFNFLVGHPIRVAAMTAIADSRYKVEDCSAVMLQSRDGAIGVIEASWTSPGVAYVIEVYGTNGAIVVDYYSKPALRYMVSNSGQWVEPDDLPPDRFVGQARHFIECVRGCKSSVTDRLDGLSAMEILEAAYASARERRIVELPPSNLSS